MYFKVFLAAGEMGQQLRALDSLPKDLGSDPRSHMTAHNSSPRGSDGLFWSLWVLYGHSAQTHADKTSIHGK